MKKRNISVILTIIILLTCCFMTSCTSLYDLAPDSYADWDGNYIYYANSRSKTTGQESEYLIESLQNDSKEYAVDYVQDFAYKDDNVYLCLRMSFEMPEQSWYEYKTCFACYDIKEQTSEVLFWETEDLSVDSIYKMTADYLILNMYDSNYNRRLVRMKYDGEILSEDDNWMLGYKEAGDYLVDWQDGAFVYTALEQEEPVAMFAFAGDFRDYDVQYYKDVNNEGFWFAIKNQNNEYSGLYFYEIVDKQLFELVAYDSGVEYIRNEKYLLVGTPKNVKYENTYVTMDIFWPKAEQITSYYYGTVVCKLYTFDLSEEGVSLQLVYDFTREHAQESFANYYLFDDGTLYFEADELVIREGGCQGKSGTNEYYYFLNPNTGELQETKELTYAEVAERSSNTQEEVSRKIGAKCGDYAYYIIAESYGGWGRRYAYTLYRCNMETDEEEVMQFWADECDFERGEYKITTDDGDIYFRYSPKSWQYYYDDTFERPQFIVRNY
ncbi:MAG: hypothetical protein E7349_02035 [Clostridiales bacterium]|nr:hypothetical protein [Clostridiales bacterium]